jgi:quercetin dioxygenase-like cupin family protein
MQPATALAPPLRGFLLLCLPFTSPAIPAAQTETVRNEKIVVVDCTIQPGSTESLGGSNASVTVYFTAGSLEIAPKRGTRHAASVKRGHVVFEPPQPRIIKNTGAAAIHFVRVEFLRNGVRELTWGTAGLSPNYKLLFENEYARVYDIRIPAGAKEPKHSHHDRVVVCLSGAQLRHLLSNGREEPSTLRTGESVWRRGGTHIGHNLGNTDLWVIAVEPK